MQSGDSELIEVMRAAARTVASVTSSATDELRVLAVARAAIDAAMCDLLNEVEQTGAHAREDASSVITWARRELRQESGRTRQMLRAAETMKHLADVGASARAGRISFDHVSRFTFALKHVGDEPTREVADVLLHVAEQHEPARLKQMVDRLRSVVHADELDAAWLAGMAKADVNLHPVPDGWHLTGFLPIDVGARFKAVLDALSTPTAAGDPRTASERRIDGLDHLLTRVLAEGLPTDGTVRPQIHVLVDAGTLKKALAPATPSAFVPSEPATLVGFGPIGAPLMAHLTCGSDLTPILVDRIVPHARVLDVGPTQRDATARQRHAIWAQQVGQCATDHCRNDIDHVHHVRPWSRGGPTDLANLIGYCAACHRHTHRHDHAARGTPLARAG